MPNSVGLWKSWFRPVGGPTRHYLEKVDGVSLSYVRTSDWMRCPIVLVADLTGTHEGAAMVEVAPVV